MFPLDTQILIVEDVASVRDVLKKLLFSCGYRHFIEAPDGQTAFKKLLEAKDTETPIDLVFTDWHMPTMSGADLLKLIRGVAEFKNLPVIFVTAEAELANVVEIIGLGATNYIVKPITLKVLRDKILATWKQKIKS